MHVPTMPLREFDDAQERMPADLAARTQRLRACATRAPMCACCGVARRLLWLCFACNLMGYFFLISWLPTVLQGAKMSASDATTTTICELPMAANTVNSVRIRTVGSDGTDYLVKVVETDG